MYLSSEDIDRFGRVSVGDLLQGIPGVQVGDSRNGGALDVNIRGIQGQSRVAVRVDGAEQALDVTAATPAPSSAATSIPTWSAA